MPKDLTAPYRMPLLPARSSGPPVAALAAHDATLALSFFPAFYYYLSFSGTKGRALTLSAFRSRESTDLGLDDMSQPPAHGNGAVQNAIPVKVDDTPHPQDHILQGNLQTRHQPATPAALGFDGVNDVRQGKYIELDLAETDEAQARAQVEQMCRKLLANTVIENFRVELA